jgi:hypothetical protein
MGKIVKAEDKYEYYDVTEDLNSSDQDRMPVRSVRLGDARLVPSRVTFMRPTTRTYETAGDMAVPKDSFLYPNLTDEATITPPQKYLCENPEHQKLHEENFLTPGESETVRPADFVAPTPSSILKSVRDGNLVPDDTKENVAKRWSKNGVSFADVIGRSNGPADEAARFMGGR